MFSKTSQTILSFWGENFVPFNLSGGVQGVGQGDHVGKTPSGKDLKKKKSFLTSFLFRKHRGAFWGVQWVYAKHVFLQTSSRLRWNLKFVTSTTNPISGKTINQPVRECSSLSSAADNNRPPVSQPVASSSDSLMQFLHLLHLWCIIPHRCINKSLPLLLLTPTAHRLF